MRDTTACCAGPLRLIGVWRQPVSAKDSAIASCRAEGARSTSTIACEGVDVDNTREEIRTRDDQERHLTDERSTPMRLA